MNANIGKYAIWYVRVLDPKPIQYQFTSKGQLIDAEKFECILVSNDPTQYMLASIPFTFADRTRAQTGVETYDPGCVLEITTPTFDTKARRQDYNGCPVRSVLLLTQPTGIKHVPPTNTEMLQYPAMGIEVSLNIKALLVHLKNLGAGKSAKTVDFVGKFQSVSQPKMTEKTPLVW